MRVKVRSIEDYVEVVDAKTGELLEGVTALSLTSSGGKASLIVHISDFDMDIDMAATISKERLTPASDPCCCRPNASCCGGSS